MGAQTQTRSRDLGQNTRSVVVCVRTWTSVQVLSEHRMSRVRQVLTLAAVTEFVGRQILVCPVCRRTFNTSMRRDGREKREWGESTVLSGVWKWKRKRDTLESTGKVGKSPADTMGREDIKVQWRQPNPCRFARYRKLRAEFWCVKSSAAVALENKCRGTTIEVR